MPEQPKTAGSKTLFFQEALKVLPWMLGATAVGYAERVRRLLIDQARHLRCAILAATFLVPLLILQTAVFSLKVRAESATVKPNKGSRYSSARDGRFRVVFPRLDGYGVTIADDTPTGRGSVPFSVAPGRFRISRGTQIPLVGRIFGPEEIALSPLYPNWKNNNISNKFPNRAPYEDVRDCSRFCNGESIQKQ